MRKHSLALLAVFGALLSVLSPASGLAQGRTRGAVSAQSYFPLELDARWQYVRTGRAGDRLWQAHVKEKRTSGSEASAYLLDGYFPGPARLVRAEYPGIVRETTGEHDSDTLWYLLGASTNASWTIELQHLSTEPSPSQCIDGSEVRLVARDEKVTVPAGTFDHVIKLELRGPCVDAGVTAEWFAPGVGLIRREETSFAGPVISELVAAQIGSTVLPAASFATTLTLDRPTYVMDLMPPVANEKLPKVYGQLILRNDLDDPVALVFSGCKSVALEVQAEDGTTVLTAAADDGGCCTCENLVRLDLANDALVIPFSFRLATEKGDHLEPGHYAVRATLQTVGAKALRPFASTVIELKATY